MCDSFRNGMQPDIITLNIATFSRVLACGWDGEVSIVRMLEHAGSSPLGSNGRLEVWRGVHE